MVEHLVDSFDSNAALLKGCIIKDGTSVMLVSILIFHCKSVDSAPLIYEENLNYCYFLSSLLGVGNFRIIIGSYVETGLYMIMEINIRKIGLLKLIQEVV